MSLRNETCLMQSWRSCIALRSNMYVTLLTQMLATLVLTDAWTELGTMLPTTSPATTVSPSYFLAQLSSLSSPFTPSCQTQGAPGRRHADADACAQCVPTCSPRQRHRETFQVEGGFSRRALMWVALNAAAAGLFYVVGRGPFGTKCGCGCGSWGGLPIYLEHSEN